jgi:hypothetical protein
MISFSLFCKAFTTILPTFKKNCRQLSLPSYPLFQHKDGNLKNPMHFEWAGEGGTLKVHNPPKVQVLLHHHPCDVQENLMVEAL